MILKVRDQKNHNAESWVIYAPSHQEPQALEIIRVAARHHFGWDRFGDLPVTLARRGEARAPLTAKTNIYTKAH